MLNDAKRIEEHVHNRKMPLENVRENARKFYQQCATNFSRLQTCEESGGYATSEVHDCADKLGAACVKLYDITHGEVIPDRFDSFSRGLIQIKDEFKVCAVQYFEGFVEASATTPDDAKLFGWELRRMKDPVSLSIHPLARYLVIKTADGYALTCKDDMDDITEVKSFMERPSYWTTRDLLLKHIETNVASYTQLAKSPRK